VSELKPSIPWLRVLIEGVVIVGSILLAFGIDAWWNERQETEAAEELARDSINMLLTTAGGIAVLSPVMRSYDQLVATGLLRRLTPPVRQGMADWIQVLENARDYQEQENLEFRRGVAFPFYASGEVAFDEMLQGYQEIDFGSPRFPLTWRDLHENRELNGILSVSAAMANVTVRLYERVDSVGDALASLLSEEYRSPRH
jgi:hypothetical protein